MRGLSEGGEIGVRVIEACDQTGVSSGQYQNSAGKQHLRYDSYQNGRLRPLDLCILHELALQNLVPTAGAGRRRIQGWWDGDGSFFTDLAVG